MADFGIPVYDVLKMATVNASGAMNKTEFGTVEVGKRADLLLLNSNPTDGIANLQDVGGVMVRGIWLSRNDIDNIERGIRSAFGH